MKGESTVESAGGGRDPSVLSNRGTMAGCASESVGGQCHFCQIWFEVIIISCD